MVVRVCIVCMALIANTVLCTRSQDSFLSVRARRVHECTWCLIFDSFSHSSVFVFPVLLHLSADEGRVIRQRETAALRKGILQASRTNPGSSPSHRRSGYGYELQWYASSVPLR